MPHPLATSPETHGTIRHGLTFAGGLLLAGADMNDAGVKEIVGLLLTLVGVIWSVVDKSRRGSDPLPPPPGGPAANALLLAGFLTFLLMVSGCARFRTVQRDVSMQPDGVSRTIETTATATTFAAGKQALAQWKAAQTDKSQTASVGGLGQESDASELMQGLMALGRMAAAMQGVPIPSGSSAEAAAAPATRSAPPAAPGMVVPLDIQITPSVTGRR